MQDTLKLWIEFSFFLNLQRSHPTDQGTSFHVTMTITLAYNMAEGFVNAACKIPMSLCKPSSDSNITFSLYFVLYNRYHLTSLVNGLPYVHVACVG